MSTLPTGIDNPERYGNTPESYAELLKKRIEALKQEVQEAKQKGYNEQVETLEIELEKEVQIYRQFYKDNFPNELESDKE